MARCPVCKGKGGWYMRRKDIRIGDKIVMGVNMRVEICKVCNGSGVCEIKEHDGGRGAGGGA